MRALIAGDVVNLLGYRMRPYEVVPGSTNVALTECKRILSETFERKGNVVASLLRCRRVLGAVQIDRTVAGPLVSVIGELWAMTTEGDGNYHLQSFLEKEGA